MTVRTAEARWEGGLKEGSGAVKLGSGAFAGPYSYPSRFEDGSGTNPEELIGAAHAGCFAMALAATLEKAGTVPQTVDARARVHFGKVGDNFAITTIELDCTAVVPGLSDEDFQRHATTAKATCPVSKALAGVEVVLTAKLGPVTPAAPTAE
ncbi:MAG: OsmC family protein [Magnetospirillum sp.]|nr:OsmC family protein [Magnetospirillum sp.]